MCEQVGMKTLPPFSSLAHLSCTGLADHGRFHVSLAEPLSTCLTQSISLRLFICTMMGNFLLNHGLNDYRHKVTADWSFEEHAHYTLWFYMYLITDPRNYAYDLGSFCCVQPWGNFHNGQNSFRKAMAKELEKPSSTGSPSFWSTYTNNDWMGKWGRGSNILKNISRPSSLKRSREQ